jgi:hypothetical protein
MFSASKTIKNNYKRFNNPVLDSEFKNKYAGPIESYTFPTSKQHDYYLGIRMRLQKYGINPLEVYAGNRNGLDTYIVTFSHPDILWRKYESKVPGGYQNYIYFRKQEVVGGVFAEMNETDVDKILKDSGIIE